MKGNEYIPHPIDTSKTEVPHELQDLLEKLAQNVHETWSAGRMKEGWTFGSQRNDELKQHPCLVPYDQLSDSEKGYDRETALQTLKVILQLGFKISKD